MNQHFGFSKSKHRFTGFAAAALLACTMCGAPAQAMADDDSSDLDALQQRVDQTAQDYDTAVQNVNDLHQQMEDNQQKIDDINAQLPEQQQRGADAVRSMYLIQNNSAGLVSMILGSENLNDFLDRMTYLNHISSHNNQEIQQLKDMRDSLSQAENDLATQTAEAEQQQQQAQQALTDAQSAREEAQRRAVEAAQRELEQRQQQEAQQQAQAQAAADAQAQQAPAPDTQDQQGVDAGNPQVETGPAEVPTETVSTNDVNWSASKTDFVNQWAPRIDNFLSSYGSPMAGYGSLFASSAWDNGVDPRWSPAISIVESSGGIYCFEPHNAWGWGSYSFGSWDEAIPAHVAYLQSMYGGSLTYSAAQRYCPPNADFWYNRCISLMNQI